ncbi:right-handed parallel beta-helix repeat-containing protein [Myxococcota bacterium]
MNTTSRSIHLLVFLLLPSLSHAQSASYFVTQTGSGSGNGTEHNAWSVSDFNDPQNWSSAESADRIDPGDTVFFSGTITSEITLQGSGTREKRIVIDGYQSDDCDPINSVCSDSAVVDRNDPESGTYYGININHSDHIIVQDFRLIACSSGIVEILPGGSNDITIRRNDLEDMRMHGIYVYGTTDATIGGANGDGNRVYNVGENGLASATVGVDVVVANHTVVSYNLIYNDSRLYSDADAIGVVGANYNLIEYNTTHSLGEDGIDFKNGSDFNIYRFNHAYNTIQSPCQVQNDTDHSYVYGNRLHRADNPGEDWSGLLIYRGADDVHAWANIIYENDGPGVGVYCQGSGDTATSVTIGIDNNTIVRNLLNASQGYHVGIFNICGTDLSAKNNILVNNQPGGYGRQIYTVQTGITLDYNHYHHDGYSAPIVNWNGTDYEITSPLTSTALFAATGQEEHGAAGVPGFSDSDNDDFTPDGTNVNNGVDLGGTIATVTIQGVDYVMDRKWALDPINTDWTTVPPTVIVVDQNAHGAGWEKGAYVHIEPDEGVCSDGTAADQCSTSAGAPVFCNRSAELVDNCSACGCAVGWTCSGAGTYCEAPPDDGPPDFDGDPGDAEGRADGPDQGDIDNPGGGQLSASCAACDTSRGTRPTIIWLCSALCTVWFVTRRNWRRSDSSRSSRGSWHP